MQKLDSMLDIGKEMKMKLMSVGISSSEDLIRIGSKEAFSQIKEHYPKVCLVHLYTLQGAIDGVKYNQLSEAMRRNLKEFSDSLK